jgi:PAP2 superfamily
MTHLALTLLLQASALSPAQVSPAPNPVEQPVARRDVVLKWNELALQAIRADRTPPPKAARSLAIMHLAMFDAVNAVYRTHQPYHVDAVPEAGASADAAAAAAAHAVMAALYPKFRTSFDEALASCLAELPAGDGQENGLDLGRFVAGKMLELRGRDGSDTVARYTPKTAPGLWQPTLPGFKAALFPGWGSVTPFAMKPGTQYRPPGPPATRDAAYLTAFNEVKELGARNSAMRTPDQTQIALFWADGDGTATPPGHWNKIAQDLAQQRRLSLAENARLFALLNMSLADAGIICWMIKFTNEFWRPVTAIRMADTDDNPLTHPDPNWTPLLDTPPFPSYTSGHSTFSGAAASTLANVLGGDAVQFTTTSEGLPGVTRSFSGLWAAAEEAGMSRIYGGIHYQFDNTDGLQSGKTLGNYVTSNYLRPRLSGPPVITEQRLYTPMFP